MLFSEAQSILIARLSDRYGPGEAASITRIVLEDAFLWKGNQADRVLTDAAEVKLSQIQDRLESGEPVQYVLGEADFFGLKFMVNPSVLIPRQETELLVALILKHLKANDLQQGSLLDIGLGSGCIGLTLKRKNTGLQLFGIEKSTDALAVAAENASRLLGEGVKGLNLFAGDILSPQSLPPLPAFDVIVSNPPYIPMTEKHLVPDYVHAHEPWMALFVESQDPLLFYRAIAVFAKEKLKPGGALFFECNEFNAGEAFTLLEALGFYHIQVHKDLANADRMLSAFTN